MSRPKHQPVEDLLAATAACLVRRHYKKIGVADGWNVARFDRLRQMLNATRLELGAICALTNTQTEMCVKRNKFPPPVSLHLAVMEAAILEYRIGRKSEPIIPLGLLQKKISVQQDGEERET